MMRTMLTKIKIIKWYEIEDIEGCISGNCLIYAKNKVGKSTIIDAIGYTLIGNKKFNRAANIHDERDLKSYVRKAVNGKYERQGFIVSNIALEFTMPDGKKKTIGVLLESKNDTDKVVSNWYFVKDEIDSIEFYGSVDGRKITLNKNDFKKINNIDTKDFLCSNNNSKQSINKRICYELNIPDVTKFESNLEKSMAFVSVKDIKKFCKTFLPENNIAIKNLATSVSNLTKLNGEYEQIEQAKVLLEDVDAAGVLYETAITRYNTRECLVERAKIESAKDSIEQSNIDIENLKMKLKRLNNSLVELEKEERKTSEDLIALERDGYGDNKKQLENIERQIVTVKEKIKSLEDKCSLNKKEIEKMSEYSAIAKGTEYEVETSYEFNKLGIDTVNIDELEKEVNMLENILGKTRDSIILALNEKEKERNKQINNISSMKKEYDNACLGMATYPVAASNLKAKIEAEFKALGINSPVKFLCDMVEEITIPKWIPAIETILGDQRYSLIVEPKYLKQAQKIQREFKGYPTFLIATNDLTDDREINENSAFAILKISNTYAKRYLHHRLNNLILCDNLDELNSVKFGITVDGYTKGSLVTSNRRIVTDFCLGKEAIKKKAEQLKEKIEEANEKLSVLKEEISLLDMLKQKITKVTCRNIVVSAFNELKDCNNELINLENEQHILKNDPNIARYMTKKEELENKKDSLMKKRDEINQGKGNLDTLIKTNKENIEKLTVEIPLLEKNLEELLDKYNLSYVDIDAQYKKEAEKKSTDAIIKAGTLAIYKSEADTAATKLRTAMSNYNNKTKTNSIPIDVQFLSRFREKYNDLKNTQIEKVRSEIEAQTEVCADILRNDLLEDLKTNLLLAKKEQQKLNRDIKKAFMAIEDDEYYEIKLEPTEDPELRAIYEIAMNNEATGIPIVDAFSDITSIIDKKLQELIDNLTKDNFDALEEFEKKICDYRNYFDCDIITHNIKTKEAISMVKKGNTTSGMETQAPYYVIMGISIVENTRKDSDPRIMIIDEAFDKMDTQNIRKVLNFLESQNIQLIMAAPPEKMNCFEDFIDTTVPLMRSKNNDIVVVGEIKYKKKEADNNE